MVKPSDSMRLWTASLLCLLCGVMAACNRWTLPVIQDKPKLQSDCTQLFQQFPFVILETNAPQYDHYQQSLGIRKIPESNWPGSVRTLHPYLVCADQNGIQIWILNLSWRYQGEKWAGYYVATAPATPPTPQAATNHFIFERTTIEGIYLLKQSRFQN